MITPSILAATEEAVAGAHGLDGSSPCAFCIAIAKKVLHAAASIPDEERAGRIYIAGPMTGIPEFNYPALHAAAKLWRDAGWVVLNPAENFDGHQGLPYAHYIRKDIADLMTCEAVAFLPGWEQSRGARLERHLAETLGMAILEAEPVVVPAERLGAS